MNTEDEHGPVQHQQAQTAQRKAHDGPGTEGGIETIRPAVFLRRDGRPDV